MDGEEGSGGGWGGGQWRWMGRRAVGVDGEEGSGGGWEGGQWRWMGGLVVDSVGNIVKLFCLEMQP